jgi:hypothetical protein
MCINALSPKHQDTLEPEIAQSILLLQMMVKKFENFISLE